MCDHGNQTCDLAVIRKPKEQLTESTDEDDTFHSALDFKVLQDKIQHLERKLRNATETCQNQARLIAEHKRRETKLENFLEQSNGLIEAYGIAVMILEKRLSGIDPNEEEPKLESSADSFDVQDDDQVTPGSNRAMLRVQRVADRWLEFKTATPDRRVQILEEVRHSRGLAESAVLNESSA